MGCCLIQEWLDLQIYLVEFCFVLFLTPSMLEGVKKTRENFSFVVVAFNLKHCCSTLKIFFYSLLSWFLISELKTSSRMTREKSLFVSWPGHTFLRKLSWFCPDGRHLHSDPYPGAPMVSSVAMFQQHIWMFGAILVSIKSRSTYRCGEDKTRQ